MISCCNNNLNLEIAYVNIYHIEFFTDALVKFFEYINSLKPKDPVDYTKCRQMFETYLKKEGKTKTSKLEFTPSKKKKSSKLDAGDQESDEEETVAPKKRAPKQNGELKTKRTRKVPKADDTENTEPDTDNTNKTKKRKSLEPSYVLKVKKTKIAPKATPPAKRNHANIATQTSGSRAKRSPRQVTFDSPICEVIGEKALKTNSINSSGDMFDDSFTIEEKKIKPKRKLLSDEEVTVKRVVRKKVTTVKPKAKSWKDSPAVVNGRSPPK